MSENDRQYRWIVTLRENFGHLLRDRPDVYVAADHLIYAQRGNPKRRAAPDVYVAFGRPKEDRGSYKVWEEENIFPQVVVEVLSPGNRRKELRRKFHFYQRYGAEEYVVIDPDNHRLKAYHRTPAGRLKRVPTDPEYVSPRLRIRYVQRPDGLTVFSPAGERFLTMDELAQAERQMRQQADAERQRADALAAKLRVLGIDPDAP
jgi:Uma2 family endonuclease